MKSNLLWFGELTHRSKNEFASFLWALLSGQTYTQVIIMRNGKPEVATDQKLIAQDQAFAFDLRPENGLRFFTASHNWFISYGSTFSFEGNKVTIEQANRDQCIYLVFAVQTRGTRRNLRRR